MAGVGSTLAGYRLEELLGRGGMGVVHRAWDDRLGRWVALKLISPELTADLAFRERFLREARLAAAVEHPHVVPVYDAGEVEGTVYLAMRLIDGRDLDSLLEEGPLDVARATTVIAQVAHALAAVHARGLVHRDVTARNVLVPVLDGREHAYLTDFGLARDAAPGGTLTDDGRWAGTLDYAAPERLRGLRADARSDVYSLGCLLYRTLTARAPFPSDDNAAKIVAHLMAPPPSLPHGVRAAAPHLEGVLQRALAKDPADRYADMLELAAELQPESAPASAPVISPPRAATTEADLAVPRSQPDFLAGTERTLHGRDRELARLAELCARPRTPPRLVLVVGEPGIGKSTLVARVAAARAADGDTIVHGRCFEQTLLPYQPFLEALGEEAASALAADADRYEALRRVESLLTRRAGGAPLLVVLDDLQWADEASVRLLEHLLRSYKGVPWLALATLRDTEAAVNRPLEGLLADLARERQLDCLPLGGLSPDAVRALAVEASDDALDEPALQRVLDDTAGNPFFVEELARHLAAAGGSTSLPESVQQVVRRRVAALGPQAQEALEVAAVIGLEFDFRLLAAASAIPEAQLAETLERAIDARLLVERPHQPGRLEFSHVLVLQALYEPMSRLRKSRLHAAVGNALETANGDTDRHLPELARHFTLAGRLGDPAKAVDYSHRAGHQAQSRTSLEEAVRHYEAALAALDLLDDPDPARAGDILLALGDARALANEPPQAILDSFERAVAVAEDADLPNLAHRARVRALLAARGYQVGDWNREAESRAREALEVFEQSGDRAGMADAWELLGMTAIERGRLSMGAEAFDSALQHVHDVNREASMRFWRLSARVRGAVPVEQLRAEVAETLAWARRRGRRLLEANCLAYSAEIAAMTDRHDEAARCWSQADELFAYMGEAFISNAVVDSRIPHAPLADDPAAAEAQIRAAVEFSERQQMNAYFASQAPVLADILVSLGRAEEALTWCERSRAVTRAEDTDAVIREHAARARALAHLGDPEQAEREARRAFEIAAETEHVHLQAAALLALAETLRLAGRHTEAASAVDEVTALLERKGDVAGARRARARVPPLASGSPRPVTSEPPTPISRTVGRDREIHAVAALLTENGTRLVTLTGPGGVGKTRLAVEVARDMARAVKRGACFVTLAGVADAGNVADAIAAALGVSVPTELSVTEAIVTALADEELLLVLDNFEHVLDAAPVVAELIAGCPWLTVLATSRERLRLHGERIFPVAPLPVPDAGAHDDLERLSEIGAVALFVDRARAQDPGFQLSSENAASVSEICARLDGLPLALELAAARIGPLDARELADRLSEALPMLAAGPRDAPDRQRTLEATIDWSFRLLPPDQQDAFTALAAFAGGCTFEAAEAVTQAPLDALLALVEKSLVARGGGRLRMLETVREFALERLRARSDAHEVRRRHAEWFVSLAEREQGALLLGTREAVRRMDAELENLRLALAWTREHDTELFTRLAIAAVDYWWESSRSLEGREWLAAAQEPHPRPTGVVRAELLLGRVKLADPFSARAAPFDASTYAADAEEALALFEASGQAAGIARSLIALSRAETWLNHRDSAVALADRAVEFARRSGDDLLIGFALAARSSPAEQYADFPADEDEALAYLRKAGSQSMVARRLSTTGFIALLRGEHDLAERVLAEATDVAAAAEDLDVMAYACGNLGLLRLAQERFDAAAAAFGQELEIWRDGRYPKRLLLVEALFGLAAVAAVRGAHETAARLLGASEGPGAERILEFEEDFWVGLERRFFDPAREALGDAHWERALAAGRSLKVSDAIEEALREAETETRPPRDADGP